MTDFRFNDYEAFTDGEIEVAVSNTRDTRPADERRGLVPSYEFAVRLPGNSHIVGRLSLRVGDTEHIVMHRGHIGYGIEEKYRGNHYAAKACNLIKPVALDHGMKTLWITCNPDNYPSRRTCEILGCEFIEIVDVPKDTDMYRAGERQMCRYRWDIG